MRNSAVSTLTTLLNGHQRHRVFGKSWDLNEKRVLAYVGAGNPRSSNIVDMLSTSFRGKSLCLSLSASAPHAMATSVHHSLRAKHPEWNNYAFEVSTKGVTKLFGQRNLMSFPSQIYDEEFVSETTQRERTFHAELGALRQTIFSLKSGHDEHLRALVQDDAPDFYAFALSSFAPLAYGRGLPEHLTQLDDTLSQAIKDMNQLYRNRVLTQIVLLDGARDLNAIEDHHILAADPDQYRPVRTSRLATYSNDDVTLYQIIFWLIVLLIIGLYLTVYPFYQIQLNDSILYRTASSGAH